MQVSFLLFQFEVKNHLWIERNRPCKKIDPADDLAQRLQKIRMNDVNAKHVTRITF